MEEKKIAQEEVNLDVSLEENKEVEPSKEEVTLEAEKVEEVPALEEKVQEKKEEKEEEPIFKDEEVDPRFAEKKDFYFPLPQTTLEENLKAINEHRSSFYEYNNNTNRIKKITLFTFVGIFFIFMIVLLINREALSKLLTPIFLVFFLFLVVTYFLVKSSKKKKGIAFDAYKKTYFTNVDSYVFYHTGISNIELSYNSKISIDEINKIGCYEHVIHTLTRDVVQGTMFGVNFLGYDLLLKTGPDVNDPKTMSTVFSGKMFHFDLFDKKAGKMVIYLKGCGDAMPTELSGLEPVDIKDLSKDYQVFSSFENPSAHLNKKTIETLNKFKIDNVIEDIIISISKEGLYFGLSLTTENMMIPFEKEVDGTFINHYKKDIENLEIFISDMLSNKNYSNGSKND